MGSDPLFSEARLQTIVLEKLEWPVLLDRLANHSQTDAGRSLCIDLRPDLDHAAIEQQWQLTVPLRDLAAGGYTVPIGDLPILDPVFRSINKGQLQTGEELRAVYDLLMVTKQVHKFCADFGEKCLTVRGFKSRTYPLPELSQTIDSTVDEAGNLRDNASPELSSIRRQKLSLRKRIESKINELLTDQEMEKYLQDKFFTVRSDRYVVPLKLDGRGRIKGSIYDTSDSGQTLYIEPADIAPLNEDLQEIELAEKLEIIRIFRQLGDRIKENLDVIEGNYDELIKLDFLSAQAILAHEYNGSTVELVDRPLIELCQAKHPLVTSPEGKQAVPNDVKLSQEQNVLIVSGPNAGGKTVVLKTVGMIHLMAKAGLLVPAAEESKLHLFDHLFVELGDSQSLSANLSTFSGHILGLKPIVEADDDNALVLLDEIAVGTEPQAGSAIAQAILESLAIGRKKTIVTTHFDALKSLAVKDKRFRNGSMEYSTKNYLPTYHLVLDVPGQSYGVEVAKQMGLPAGIINRSLELRGNQASALDEIVSELTEQRRQLRAKEESLDHRLAEIETERAHWESERQELREARGHAATKLKDRYEREVRDLQTELLQVTDSLKKQLKNLQETKDPETLDQEEVDRLKLSGNKSLQGLNQTIRDLQSEATPIELPGKNVPFEELNIGDRVYIVSLHQEGRLVKLGSNQGQPIEVQAGSLSMWLPLTDLRYLGAEESKTASKRNQKSMINYRKKTPDKASKKEISLTIQTLTNSVDLRGMDVEAALAATWKFIDQALLRGEVNIMLIHGHGENKLKAGLREALTKDCPYKIRFRAGQAEEGGDGVTVIALD